MAFDARGLRQIGKYPVDRYLAEGGIRNALIVTGAGVALEKGSIDHNVLHVADIMPTLLELAGATYPETKSGKKLPPLIGRSWMDLLSGRTETLRSDKDALAWEVFGNRALRKGPWKIRWQWKSFGKETWSSSTWSKTRPNGLIWPPNIRIYLPS